jgi:hypothetical protein
MSICRGTPANIGTATPGTSTDYARGDHVHAAQLADLGDVSSAAPSSGQVLAWGGSEWAPATPAAAPTPSSATPQTIGTATPGTSTDYARGDHAHAGALADLSDVASTAPSSGQVLAWGGSEWAPATPSGGGTPSSATPQTIGTATAGTSTDYARGDHVHAGNVTGLGDRFVALPLQSRSQFASASRDIQTAINAHTTGDAAIVLVSPGSYPGSTVTIGTGYNNFAVCGAAGTPYGGTICSLSSGRALTVSGTATRIRLQNLQVEGLTTWATSGAGVHRIDRCQLVGGLSVSGFSASQQLVITDCQISGTVTIPAGFLGVVLFDHCDFAAGYSISNGATAAQVIVGNCSGVTSSTGITLQGWVSNASGVVTGYANGAAVITPALTAIGATTPATNRLPYFASGSTASTTTFTAAGREIVATAASGTAGQVLTSAGGGGAPPTWTTVSGGSGLPTSQSWTVDFRPTSTSSPTLSASGFTLVGLTSAGLFADANGNIYEQLTQTGTTSLGYFYATGQTVTNAIPWEMEFDVWTTLLDGFCTIQANEGAGTGNYRWRLFYNVASGSTGSWQHQGSGGASNLSTPYDVQTSSRVIMGMQSEPRASRAFYANGQCVGLVNPSGNATGSSGTTDYAGLFVFGNSSTTSTAITMRVYGARVLVNGRGTAPPYARNPWPPIQP